MIHAKNVKKKYIIVTRKEDALRYLATDIEYDLNGNEIIHIEYECDGKIMLKQTKNGDTIITTYSNDKEHFDKENKIFNEKGQIIKELVVSKYKNEDPDDDEGNEYVISKTIIKYNYDNDGRLVCRKYNQDGKTTIDKYYYDLNGEEMYIESILPLQNEPYTFKTIIYSCRGPEVLTS